MGEFCLVVEFHQRGSATNGATPCSVFVSIQFSVICFNIFGNFYLQLCVCFLLSKTLQTPKQPLLYCVVSTILNPHISQQTNISLVISILLSKRPSVPSKSIFSPPKHSSLSRVSPQEGNYQTRCSRGCSTNTFVMDWFSQRSFSSRSSKYHKSQTGRARGLKFWENVHPP